MLGYRLIILPIVTALLMAVPLFAAPPSEESPFTCGTPPIPHDLAAAVQRQLDENPPAAWPKSDLIIPVAVHLIRWGKKGDFPNPVIQTLVDNMNWAFDGTGIRFQLIRIDRTNNKAWHLNCYGNNESKMKKRLAYYPGDVLNIYSCYMPGGLLGIATFPLGMVPAIRSYPEDHFMQGILIAPNTMPVTSSLPDYWYGLTAAHEAGHWLGLLHTFHPGFPGFPSGCSEPGDFVTDTPVQNLPSGACIQKDTCPQAGLDDFTNFMDYRPDDCADHFTIGQEDRMYGVIYSYRQSLLH